jgi:hypothetical protein
MKLDLFKCRKDKTAILEDSVVLNNEAELAVYCENLPQYQRYEIDTELKIVKVYDRSGELIYRLEGKGKFALYKMNKNRKYLLQKIARKLAVNWDIGDAYEDGRSPASIRQAIAHDLLTSLERDGIIIPES